MKTQKQASGSEGERLAMLLLQDKGFEILHQNWRHKRLEVDIIAKSGNVVVFVEVKMRANDAFGHAEDFVDDKKQKNLMAAAGAYIEETGWEGELRFDIVGIRKVKDKMEINHIEDAFYW